MAFKKHIIDIVGEVQYKSFNLRSRTRMMDDFESIKKSFTGANRDHSVDLRGVQNDVEHGINDDTITLKTSAILFPKS